MRRDRTTAPSIFLSLLLAGLGIAAIASPGAGGAGESVRAVPRLIFPLVAKTDLWDNYGDPRPNGRHAGIDMENPWRAPVVAVEAGRVQYAESRLGGCMLYLYGQSGTTYMYIHLNNDLTPRNDDRGRCVKDVAYAVPDGARVSAGEQVGWNGDSGDASGNPHLHFEVHPLDGVDVNPLRHLRRAKRPLFAARLGTPFSLGLRGNLLAAGGGSVELEVERVRHYPGGRWLAIEPRTVELVLAVDASVAAALGDLTTGALAFRSAVPVVAYTSKARTTAEALLGEAGALTAKRLLPIG